MPRIAYVVEAYFPRGGNYMAYHVARILHQHFGFEVFAVTTSNRPQRKAHRHGIFAYDPIFPCVTLAEAERRIRNDDVLLCNPIFSDLNLGSRLRGFKISYVQSFSTYRFLDLFFDRYVAVSGFVSDYLRNTYGLDASVIPAFIDNRNIYSRVVPWENRPRGSVVLNLKGILGDRDQQVRLLHRLRMILADKDGELEASIDWNRIMQVPSPLPHVEFVERLSAARYLLTLSVAEGFGLIPLEAMATGTVVVGFDGYGGRDYMVSGGNCAVAQYPDLAGVADCIIAVMRDEAQAKRLSEAGQLTAARYSYDSFRRAWIAELARMLPD